MKRKALVVALALAMGLVVFSVGNAMAAPATYTCTISQAGGNYWGYYVITLTDTASPAAFTNQQFFIPDDGSGMNKVMYAAALTALANSTNVQIYADPVTTACFLVYATK
jgi:hypothetical protein